MTLQKTHEKKGLERRIPICTWLAKIGEMMGFEECARDPAVCSLWWKLILHSSAFPTRARAPFRVYYAKSITFAFSLCVEPLNSITIACCHDNTVVHFLQRGTGWKTPSVQLLERIMQPRWCESVKTMWIMSAASPTRRISEKTHFCSCRHFWFLRRGRGCVNVCHTLKCISTSDTHMHRSAGFICSGLAQCQHSLLLFHVVKVPSSVN